MILYVLYLMFQGLSNTDEIISAVHLTASGFNVVADWLILLKTRRHEGSNTQPKPTDTKYSP